MRASATNSKQIRAFLLGQFRIERVGRTVRLTTRKFESLVAYLVLHPGEHNREKLAALLWGDYTDSRARNSLRNALTVLRGQLGPGVIEADHEVIRLNPAHPIWTDAIEFNVWVNDFLSRAPFDDGSNKIELYQGDLLAGLYDDWIVPEHEHCKTLYLDALLRLTQEMRSRSEYGRAVEYAQRIIASDRANERAHQHLMFCYLAMGNRPSALKQYEECRRALAEELAVEPAVGTTTLYEWIRQTPSLDRPLATRVTNLPVPISSFIGRGRETAQIKELIDQTRWVTLTGAGGGGKTRLAIQAATDLVDHFREGVWWVDLSAVMDEALIPQAVSRALGIVEQAGHSAIDTLCIYLMKKELLLLLDNCEHLIGACGRLIERLLEASAGLKVLATSREAFGITGENLFLVPALSFPAAQHPVSLPMTYESIRLFTERARAVNQDFRMTARNAIAIAQICRRLEGIPLALELAAARVRMLTVEEIAARLDERFSLLDTGSRGAQTRQQTLRASFEWSYDLLPPDEAVLFNRLGACWGGFELEAAEQIAEAGDRSRVLALLAALVDKSLLTAEPRDDRVRYSRLESIRYYTRSKLEESGESQIIFKRHAEYYGGLAEEGYEKLRGGEQAAWLSRLEEEHDNLRAAIQWARTSGYPETGLRIAGALWLFWLMRGYRAEGRSLLVQALASVGWKLGRGTVGSPLQYEPSPSLARALHGAAQFVYREGDQVAGRLMLEASVALWRAVGDLKGLARALNALGELARVQGDYQTARSSFESSLAACRELEYDHGIAMALSNLGQLNQDRGDYVGAEALFQESIKIWRLRNDRRGVALATAELGVNAQFQKHNDQARRLFAESLTIQRELRLKDGIASTLQELARVARVLGDPVSALAYAQEASTLNEELGNRLGRAWSMYNIGQVALSQSNGSLAQDEFVECVGLFLQAANIEEIAASLAGFAGVAAARGSWARAARLLGSAQGLLDRNEFSRVAFDRADFEQCAELTTRAIGATVFAARFTEGRGMTVDSAIELAKSSD